MNLNESLTLLKQNLNLNKNEAKSLRNFEKTNKIDIKNNTNEILISLKYECMKEIEYELEYIKNIDLNDKLFIKHKTTFLNLITNFSEETKHISNIKSLYSSYWEYRRKYQKIIYAYLDDFYESSKILVYEGYYETLEEIRKEMKKQIENRLQAEIYKIHYHENYKDLEPIIMNIKEKYILKCLYGKSNKWKIQEDFGSEIALVIRKKPKKIQENFGNEMALVIKKDTKALKKKTLFKKQS